MYFTDDPEGRQYEKMMRLSSTIAPEDRMYMYLTTPNVNDARGV